MLAKGLKVNYETPVSQVERFMYLSSDITEELLSLSPPEDPSEGLEKFKEIIKPKLQGFIRSVDRLRSLEQEKQNLISSLSVAAERVSLIPESIHSAG